METNALYFGDNMKVLSERHADGTFRFPSESVDLVYLDPPFNSNRNYNLIFREVSGNEADALIQAFEDTWHWDATARDTFEDLTTTAVNDGRIPHDVGRLIEALVRGIGHNDMNATKCHAPSRRNHSPNFLTHFHSATAIVSRGLRVNANPCRPTAGRSPPHRL